MNNSYNQNIENICVVFVCNNAFYHRFQNICNKLRTIGQYNGDITLIIGIDMNINELKQSGFIIENRINVIQLPDIQFPEYINSEKQKISGNDGRHINNTFQWHKLHVFNSYFKQWRYVLYIDSGMTLYRPIQPILDLRKPNRLLAHQDGFPEYNWTLEGQFDTNHITHSSLREKYNLTNKYYFQTGIMLFDTNIIHHDTFEQLYSLAIQFPMSKTNEQAIMNLYFISNNVYEPLPIISERDNIYYYDFKRRYNDKGYIITARDM